MSWKYTVPYATRDLSSSRDSSGQSKFGSSLGTSKFGTERQSRWSMSNSATEPARSYRFGQADQSPARAKASACENPSSIVQRLKERYSSSDSIKSESDRLNSLSHRPYGRSLTTYGLGSGTASPKQTSYESESRRDFNSGKPTTLSDSKATNSKLDANDSLASKNLRVRTRAEKTLDSDASASSEPRYRKTDYLQSSSFESKLYSPKTAAQTYSSRFHPTKTSSNERNSDSASVHASSDKNENNPSHRGQESQCSNEGEFVTVVARGTSPSQTTSSIYLRSRRSDFGIEKKIHRPKIKPPVSHKETQTERTEESHFSKYLYTDVNSRIKPWTNYVERYSGGSSAYGTMPRFSSRSSYKSDVSRDSSTVASPTRSSDHYGTDLSASNSRSLSRESGSSEPRTPESFPVSPAPSIESPQSPRSPRDNFRQGEPHLIGKPPTSFRSTESIKINLQKPISPIRDGDRSATPRKPSSSNTPLKIDISSASEDRAKSPTLASVDDGNVKKISSPKSGKSPEAETPRNTPNSSKGARNNVGTAGAGRAPFGESNKTAVNGSARLPKPYGANDATSDSSSMSESSSEDETSSSDEEVERIKASEKSFVKKSITNFLQNIPNALTPRKQPSSADVAAMRSKSGVLQKLSNQLGPPPKITFNRIESGERAWWMDGGDQVPEGVVKILSNYCLAKPKQSNDAPGNEMSIENGDADAFRVAGEIGHSNQLIEHGNDARSNDTSESITNPYACNSYLINRQFTRDLDWLRDSRDDLTKNCNGAEDAEKAIATVDGNNNNVDGLPREGCPNPSRSPSNSRSLDALHETEIVNCDVARVDGGVLPETATEDERTNSTVDDNALNFRTGDESNACSNLDNRLPKAPIQVAVAAAAAERRTEADADSEEEPIDVTPALRRRRENRGKSPEDFCQQDTIHQSKSGQVGEIAREIPNNSYLSDHQAEMKDRSQNAQTLQNGIASPVEEKNIEIGDMSGMISKAKAGLVSKSKTKLDVRKSSSREMSPKILDHGKHEIELYWKELVDSINRPLRLCDLDFTDLNTDDETDILESHREEGEIPPPPPMLILPPTNRAELKVPTPPISIPPPSNRIAKAPVPPPPILPVKNKKTVKLFWKEVKDEPLLHVKQSGCALIWDELGKVSVDTQKLEHLFESRAKDLITKKQQDQNKNKEIIVLDHKRSNAINIGMTKLPPPRAIKTAILKMDSTVVNKEGIEKLLTMLPTEEEKLRIQDAQSSNPDLPLGSAEQFLLILASISELEARLKLWAFKLDFENCEREICEPLMDLKQGVEILRSNRTFRAILGTLLSIGNFLNGCDVKGFQIDYLSKVPEVKDTVQKHSLLHHLCAIVMEKFPDSTDLYSEIGAVTRASKVDFDELSGNIKKIEEECKLSWNYLKMIAKHEGHTGMKVKMSDFLADCAERIIVLGTVHKRIMSRFHKFIFWLGIPMNRISITRPNELFKIVSEFALEYRTTRERILQQLKKMNHREKSRSRGHLAQDSNDFRKMNSKEAKDDAKLRQLLGGDATCTDNMHRTSTWRRHRKDARNLLDVANNNDDEIIETLIKTANQIPSHRPSMKDRRRSTRIIDRNS